jgi:hypothetical protein
MAPVRVAVAVVGETPRLAHLVEGAVAAVVEEELAHRVVGDQQVGRAVVVDVDGQHREPLSCRHLGRGVVDVDPRRLGDVGERAVAVVTVEVVVGAFVVERRAVRTADAGELVTHLGVDRRRPLDVVADEEVEVPVAVHIEERGAGAPGVRVAAHLRLGGDVDQLALDVAEQVIPADRGDEHVGPTVAVVVAHRHAHAVEIEPRTGGGRHVLEATLAHIAVDRDRRRVRALRTVRPARPVDQHEVGRPS